MAIVKEKATKSRFSIFKFSLTPLFLNVNKMRQSSYWKIDNSNNIMHLHVQKEVFLKNGIYFNSSMFLAGTDCKFLNLSCIYNT